MKPGENLPAFLKPSIDGTGTGFYRVVGERWKKGYKKKSFASGIISGLQRIGVYGDTIYGSSCLAANTNGAALPVYTAYSFLSLALRYPLSVSMASTKKPRP